MADTTLAAANGEALPLKKRMKNANKKKMSPLKKRENILGWVFCAPVVVGLLVFTAFPLIMSILSMFYEWDGLTFVTQAEFAGFANFQKVFAGIYSKMFWKSLLNTLLFALQLPICLVLGLFVALGMNRRMVGAKTFRVLYYLPSVMSIVAVTIIFQKLFTLDGYINTLLGTKIGWLVTDGGIVFTVNFLLVWKGIGYTSLMYIAGLQSVSPDQIEAARIDGANRWTIFRKITLPALYPVTFYLLLTGLIGSVQVFNEPFILAQYGTNYNAMTVVSYVYYFFGQKELGVSAVASWFLAFLLLIITMIQLHFDNKRDKDV